MASEPLTWEDLQPRVSDLATAVANEVVSRHASDMAVHGLPAQSSRAAFQFAVAAIPPLRYDDFNGPDGPLNTWSVHHRRLSVSGGHAVSPAPTNSLVYGIQAPVRAATQRITAGIRFTGTGQVRLTLRDGTNDAMTVMIERSGRVVRYLADFSEAARFSLYDYFAQLTAELFVDFSVVNGTASLNVDGVPVHSFETSGTTGDSVTIDVLNYGELNRVAIYGGAL